MASEAHPKTFTIHKGAEGWRIRVSGSPEFRADSHDTFIAGMVKVTAPADCDCAFCIMVTEG
jgi:hypothetical protein